MRPALLRMAIRYLEDSDEAEDAVQDVLLKLWFLRDRLDQYRSVDALAIVITKHLCINRLRGIRIEKVDLEQGISIGGGENPEMKLVEEENMQEILEVIGTLPDLQQSIPHEALGRFRSRGDSPSHRKYAGGGTNQFVES